MRQEGHYFVEIMMMFEPTYPIFTAAQIAKEMKLDVKTARHILKNMTRRWCAYKVKGVDAYCGSARVAKTKTKAKSTALIKVIFSSPLT